ncbi:uncharacterized protein [Blastocystis hominis]|uniref:Uncharacterized protein n=1 Tax=Blastocystis hominis TaxID=12968 RepID=D8M2Z1_BLAHO|nr:uncharacterized protein [Blastocystis hominis]CBK22714.2 unnamed protein product [Blastocystis hominis]|eukprot:XP_012896762.1 uncharacterized protein [Blastocystis hominis]
MCGEEYTLVDIEDDYLLLEGNQKRGWCSLRYCEIIWMDSFKDKNYSQLRRIVPFSLPSVQCSDDLRINHITMQTLRMSDQNGRSPVDGDTVVLRVHLYLWYSIRGYMYQFFNTNEHPLYHVVGEQDNSVITELIDHKLKLMRQGEKTMIILHSLAEAPKELLSFLDDCRDFYMCYVIDMRVVQKRKEDTPQIAKSDVVLPPKKPAKPEGLRITYDSASSSRESSEVPIFYRHSSPVKSPSPRPILPARPASRPNSAGARENGSRGKPPELPPKPVRSAEMKPLPAKPPKPQRLRKA